MAVSIKITSASAIKDVSATINYTVNYSEYPSAPDKLQDYTTDKWYLNGTPTVKASDGGNLAATSSSVHIAVTAGSQITYTVTLTVNLIQRYVSSKEYQGHWSGSATSPDGSSVTGSGDTGWKSTKDAAKKAASNALDAWKSAREKEGCTNIKGDTSTTTSTNYATQTKTETATSSISFYTHPGATSIPVVNQGWITEDTSVLTCFDLSDFESKVDQWKNWYNQGVSTTLSPKKWSEMSGYLTPGVLSSFYGSWGKSVSYSSGQAVTAAMFTDVADIFNEMGEGKTVTAS